MKLTEMTEHYERGVDIPAIIEPYRWRWQRRWPFVYRQWRVICANAGPPLALRIMEFDSEVDARVKLEELVVIHKLSGR